MSHSAEQEPADPNGRTLLRGGLALVGGFCAGTACFFSFAAKRADNSFFDFWSGNSLGALFAILAFFALGWLVLGRPREPRTFAWSVVAGLVLGVAEFLGKPILAYHSAGVWLDSPANVFAGLLVLIGFSWMGFVAASAGYDWLVRSGRQSTSDIRSWPPRLDRLRDAVRSMHSVSPGKLFLLVLGLLSLGRIPYLVWAWPGYLSPDSLVQIRQTLGLEALTNHSAVAHTLIIGAFTVPAAAIGHVALGVATYNLAQIVATSAAMAYAVTRMLSWRAPFWVPAATFGWFLLFPMHSAFAVTMWSNVPFAFAMLVITVMLVDLALNPNMARRPGWLAGFGVSLLGLYLFRPEGPAIVLAVAIAGLILARRALRLRLLLTVLVSVAASLIITGPIYSSLHVQPNSLRSALSLPLQQIARTSLDRGQTLDATERAFVASVFGGRTPTAVGALYDPELSDPIKLAMNENWVRPNLLAFVKGWARLGLSHPSSYLNSVLSGCYGYWYPEYQRAYPVPAGISSSPAVPGITPQTVSPSLRPLWKALFMPRMIPGASMVYSVGVGFHAAILLFGALILTRRRRYAWCLLPLAVVWLVCLTSPLPGEYRYAYPYLIALPVIAAMVLSRQEVADGTDAITDDAPGATTADPVPAPSSEPLAATGSSG